MFGFIFAADSTAQPWRAFRTRPSSKQDVSWKKMLLPSMGLSVSKAGKKISVKIVVCNKPAVLAISINVNTSFQVGVKKDY